MRLFKRIVTGFLVFLLSAFLLLVIPRLWSAINPGKPPVGYHFTGPVNLALFLGLEDLIDKTPEVPSGIREIRDIEYKNINGKSLQLDMYIPKNIKEPAPLLVFIHGGSWKGGKRSDYLVYLVAFAEKGYITSTVSYRLLKDAPYPACVEDITDAVDWFFRNGENYGYDPGRIALVGGSAGAHLALLAAYGWKKPEVAAEISVTETRKPGIKAVVDIYGPVDLTTEYARTQPLVTNFLAHSYQEAPELYREASPVIYLDEHDPPTMILHGTSDKLVPVSQSDTLKSKLDATGVPCVYHRLPLWPHTMDLVKRVNDFCQVKMEDFFEEYLKE